MGEPHAVMRSMEQHGDDMTPLRESMFGWVHGPIQPAGPLLWHCSRLCAAVKHAAAVPGIGLPPVEPVIGPPPIEPVIDDVGCAVATASSMPTTTGANILNFSCVSVILGKVVHHGKSAS